MDRDESLQAHQVSPYHPDFNREQDEGDLEEDEEEIGGVDVGCVPPLGAQRGLLTSDHQVNETGNQGKRETFPSLWKDEDEENNRSFISGGSDSEEIDQDEDEDDDLPLARNGQVRVRRGSEGYEVKPRSFNLEYQVEEESLLERKRREEEERENYLRDQERLQRLGFGVGEHLDEEERRSRDMILEEQSWRRTELERERRELLTQGGIVDDKERGQILGGGRNSVILPSEMMRRRQQENLEGAATGLRPPLDSSRRPSAASSVNTSGDWGDE